MKAVARRRGWVDFQRMRSCGGEVDEGDRIGIGREWQSGGRNGPWARFTGDGATRMLPLDGWMGPWH